MSAINEVPLDPNELRLIMKALGEKQDRSTHMDVQWACDDLRAKLLDFLEAQGVSN